jgi:hypothetical protein
VLSAGLGDEGGEVVDGGGVGDLIECPQHRRPGDRLCAGVVVGGVADLLE